MTRYSCIIMDRLDSFASPIELRQRLIHIQRCGYSGVELNRTKPQGIDLNELSQWLWDLGLAAPSFLTGEAYFDGLYLSSPDREVRGSAVDTLVGYLEIARQFSAILVVGLMQSLRSDEPLEDVAKERIAERLARVAEAAETAECEFVIDPVRHLQVGFNNSMAEVLALVDKIGSTAVRPMVDTIHMNIEEEHLLYAIRGCGSRLRHIHLCESNGAVFGTGHIDFAGVLQTLEEIGYARFASVKVYCRAGFEEAS